jgi:hypothetical protein
VVIRPESRFSAPACRARLRLGDVLDHLDELVDGIALPARKLDQLSNLLYFPIDDQA